MTSSSGPVAVPVHPADNNDAAMIKVVALLRMLYNLKLLILCFFIGIKVVFLQPDA